MNLTKAALVTVGILFVPIGCLTMVSPIPGGSLVLPAAVATLIYASPFFRGLVKRLRERMPRLNKLFLWAETKAGKKIGGTLMLTRPDSLAAVDSAQDEAERSTEDDREAD